MTGEHRTVESELEREVAARLTSDGYTVVQQPARDLIPFDLGAYRPDILATKTGENVIVEVKTSARSSTIDRLKDVADEVRRHPGWRFLLVTGSDAEGINATPLLTWNELRFKLNEGERLLATGESDAAFLILWPCVEAAMRLRARETNVPIERFPTSSLIRQLYSHGELSMSQYDRALAQLENRNKAVHGFVTENLRDAAEDVARLARELLQEWGQDGTGASPAGPNNS